MPLGLWKSKWEIHREDMERRDTEWREERARFDERCAKFDERCAKADERCAKFDERCAKADERWVELREECRDLRVDYDREVTETRLFNRELLIRLEKSQARVASALEALEEQLQANTDAVKAQTEAIFRLVDRFEEAGGRPPV